MDDDEYFETKMELNMTLDDIRNEPIESERIPRCKKCKRMCFAHDGPTGLEKCKLDTLEDEQALQEDDEKVNKIREKERVKKRKIVSDSEDHNSTIKKIRTDSTEPKKNIASDVKVDEDSKSNLKKKESDVKTDEELKTLEEKLKKKEEETLRLKKRIQEEEEKQSKYHGGAKRKNFDRRTRSRSQSYRQEYRDRHYRRSKSSSREYRSSRYEKDRYRESRHREREYSRSDNRFEDHNQYNRN